MPEMIVRIVGDTSSLERSYKRAAAGTSRFTKEVERAGRGATVAAVGFKGLGRAATFASAQFLGGAGLAYAIKSTVTAAEEAQKVTAQTRAALKAGGESWQVYGKRIQDAALAEEKLSGFTDEELMQSFTLLYRGTRSVSEALKLNAVAADVARGRNMSLASAAQLLVRVNAGQVGSLRRLGIEVQKGISGQQALTEVSRQYAGAAEAYGRTAQGAQDRFRASVDNLQEAVGKALLPTVTVYLNKASVWLENSRHQKQVTDTLAASVHALAVETGLAARTAGDLYTAWSRLDGLFRHVPGAPGGLGEIIRKGIPNLPGYGIYQGIKGLERGLGGPKQGRDPFTTFALIAEAAVGQLQRAVSQSLAAVNRPTASPYGADVPRPVVPPTYTAAQRNTWFDARITRMLDRTQDITTIQGQISRLKQIGGLIQQRINATRDVTRKLNLEDTLTGVFRQIRADQQQLADQAKAAADQAKQRRQAMEQSMFDWLQLGIDRAGLTDKLGDDLRALRKFQRVVEQRIKAEGYTLDLAQKLLNVQLQIKAVRDQQKQKLGDTLPYTPFRHYSPEALAALVGLPGDRRAEAILSAIGRGGTLPNRSGQFTGGVVITGDVHVHGVQDVAGFENAMVKQGRAKGHARRGAR